MEPLTPATVEAVLGRLGFSTPPAADRAGLDALYLAWCRTVPFDNLVKRIDLAAGTTPFRNDTPQPFFALFLAHGCGGTCWPSSRALGALLHSVGFDVRLGSASMGDEVMGRVHSHGTVVATVDGGQLWVDSSMLTDAPVPLVPGAAARSTIRSGRYASSPSTVCGASIGSPAPVPARWAACSSTTTWTERTTRRGATGRVG